MKWKDTDVNMDTGKVIKKNISFINKWTPSLNPNDYRGQMYSQILLEIKYSTINNNYREKGNMAQRDVHNYKRNNDKIYRRDNKYSAEFRQYSINYSVGKYLERNEISKYYSSPISFDTRYYHGPLSEDKFKKAKIKSDKRKTIIHVLATKMMGEGYPTSTANRLLLRANARTQIQHQLSIEEILTEVSDAYNLQYAVDADGLKVHLLIEDNFLRDLKIAYNSIHLILVNSYKKWKHFARTSANSKNTKASVIALYVYKYLRENVIFNVKKKLDNELDYIFKAKDVSKWVEVNLNVHITDRQVASVLQLPLYRKAFNIESRRGRYNSGYFVKATNRLSEVIRTRLVKITKSIFYSKGSNANTWTNNAIRLGMVDPSAHFTFRYGLYNPATKDTELKFEGGWLDTLNIPNRNENFFTRVLLTVNPVMNNQFNTETYVSASTKIYNTLVESGFFKDRDQLMNVLDDEVRAMTPYFGEEYFKQLGYNTSLRVAAAGFVSRLINEDSLFIDKHREIIRAFEGDVSFVKDIKNYITMLQQHQPMNPMSCYIGARTSNDQRYGLHNNSRNLLNKLFGLKGTDCNNINLTVNYVSDVSVILKSSNTYTGTIIRTNAVIDTKMVDAYKVLLPELGQTPSNTKLTRLDAHNYLKSINSYIITDKLDPNKMHMDNYGYEELPVA